MLYFRALASGSSGNAYLLTTPKAKILFDAGLRPPKLQAFLRDEGIGPGDLSAILISHEHSDHCLSARDLSLDWQIPTWANIDVLRAAKLHDLDSAAILDVGSTVRFGDVHVTCFPVSHDAVRPVGFLVQTAERTVVIATDLGTPTPEVVEAVHLADLIVLEANHDVEMLQKGRYPHYLRRRVAGPTGHLSNTQTAGILRDHVKGPDVDVWLAHLSKENNSPSLALATVKKSLKRAGLDTVGVQVASRDKPSLRWSGVPRPRQLPLFALSETI